MAHRYPGRDVRIDDELGARRVEWFRGQKMKGNPWNPVGDAESEDITCKLTNSPTFFEIYTEMG
jgi:hypothetical protein